MRPTSILYSDGSLSHIYIPHHDDGRAVSCLCRLWSYIVNLWLPFFRLPYLNSELSITYTFVFVNYFFKLFFKGSPTYLKDLYKHLAPTPNLSPSCRGVALPLMILSYHVCFILSTIFLKYFKFIFVRFNLLPFIENRKCISKF